MHLIVVLLSCLVVDLLVCVVVPFGVFACCHGGLCCSCASDAFACCPLGVLFVVVFTVCVALVHVCVCVLQMSYWMWSTFRFVCRLSFWCVVGFVRLVRFVVLI